MRKHLAQYGISIQKTYYMYMTLYVILYDVYLIINFGNSDEKTFGSVWNIHTKNILYVYDIICHIIYDILYVQKYVILAKYMMQNIR